MLKKTLESPLDCKEIKPVNPKGNQSWKFIGKIDGEAEAPIFWQRIWRADSLEERLKARGEEDNRGQDDWMASPTQWTQVWASSGRWWRTGKLGGLQSMGSQRVRHNLATEQQSMFPKTRILKPLWCCTRTWSVPTKSRASHLNYSWVK